MSISLAELLPLLGRLDDAPGFDTPRERLRRFLLERATDLATLQPLIDECQRSVGEQHHRVLQDLITAAGRILQFAVTFGSYAGPADDVNAHGRWRSAGVLEVVLQIETDHTTADLEPLASAVAASRATLNDVNFVIGLCIVARQSSARGKLAKLIAQSQFADIRIVSVSSLLSLAAHVATDRVSHAEVVELLQTSAALDFMIDLVTRPDTGARSNAQVAEAPSQSAVDDPRPAYWVAVINGDASVTPDRWLTSVVADRQVLAVGNGEQGHDHGSPGDWVCFFLANKGIVGHAQLGYIVEDGATVVRHGERFGRVYRLAHLTMYERPVVQALRAGRPFAVPSSLAPLAGSCLAPISRQDFLGLTVASPAEHQAPTA